MSEIRGADYRIRYIGWLVDEIMFHLLTAEAVYFFQKSYT